MKRIMKKISKNLNEIMTSNISEKISKLCRICLGEGEFNMLECVLQIPAEDEEIITVLEHGVTALEMLSVFSKNSFNEGESDSSSAHLICQLCLNELIPSFLFSRKVSKADRKLALFWEGSVNDAVSGRSEQFGNCVTDHGVESIKEELLIDADSRAIFSVNSDTFKKSPKYEQIHGQDARENLRAANGQKRRKIGKSPTFVLTGGVSKILSHVGPATVCKENIATPHKRLKRAHRAKSMLEEGSFVVTQFIDSSVQMASSGSPRDGERLPADDDPPKSDLRTMDYAVVEIVGRASELHIEETDTLTSTSTTKEPCDYSNAVYICKYCPQAFSAAKFLMAHMRKCHVCQYCTQSFKHSFDLHAHIRRVHTVHKCVICAKELSTHSNLRGHIERMHGVKLPAQVALLDYRRSTSVDVQTAQPPEEPPQLNEAQNYECIDYEVIEEDGDNVK